MTVGIYCYTSKTSAKSYVGQSWDIENRYGSGGSRTKCVFASAVKKYGWADFELTIVECGHSSQIELDESEQFWIAYLQTKSPNGYNLTDGGFGSSGLRHTDSAKEKMRNHKFSDSHLQHLQGRRSGFAGKKHKPESIEKMRKPKSESHKRAQRARKCSESTKAKISAAAKTRDSNAYQKGWKTRRENQASRNEQKR